MVQALQGSNIEERVARREEGSFRSSFFEASLRSVRERDPVEERLRDCAEASGAVRRTSSISAATAVSGPNRERNAYDMVSSSQEAQR